MNLRSIFLVILATLITAATYAQVQVIRNGCPGQRPSTAEIAGLTLVLDHQPCLALASVGGGYRTSDLTEKAHSTVGTSGGPGIYVSTREILLSFRPEWKVTCYSNKEIIRKICGKVSRVVMQATKGDITVFFAYDSPEDILELSSAGSSPTFLPYNRESLEWQSLKGQVGSPDFAQQFRMIVTTPYVDGKLGSHRLGDHDDELLFVVDHTKNSLGSETFVIKLKDASKIEQPGVALSECSGSDGSAPNS